jgi:hypothetical protein
MTEEASAKVSMTARVCHWLKALAWRHKAISALVLIYAIWQVMMTPIVNPFASDVYTIRGRFPFDQGFELIFVQSTYGTAKWYRRKCGGIQVEESVCYGERRVLKPTRLDGQNYEIKIYRDRYFAGFAGWKADGISHAEYKVNMGIDPAKVLNRAYANDENSACDGSEESIESRKGRLFCMGQIDHKDYKRLVIKEGLPLKPSEQLMNFWLYTESDAMLQAEKTK